LKVLDNQTLGYKEEQEMLKKEIKQIAADQSDDEELFTKVKSKHVPDKQTSSGMMNKIKLVLKIVNQASFCKHVFKPMFL